MLTLKIWEFHDVYPELTSDVLLLADIFEAFRNVCARDFGSDPVCYCWF